MYCANGFLLDLGVDMKVTMTKIWVAAALLALIGIAQAQSKADAGIEMTGQLMNGNPYLTSSQK